jgi:hypothetical protein
MWISILDSLPEENCIVFVLLDNGEYAVAEYSKHWGFQVDSSGYDIYALDDSGLSVSFDGNVSFWMSIPKPHVK